MKVSTVFRVSTLARTGVALSALLLGSTAFAQSGEEAIDPNAPETGAPIDTEIGDTPAELEESATTGTEGTGETSQIVVTGTLVRGIAPPGASPVSVSDEDIQATGATNVNDVLESVPQLGNFGGLTAPVAASQEVSTNKPSLRNISSNTSGGSTTLVLMDGHRLVGMGTASTVPDPDIIPPGVLQRVEIVPDGGSAIYGSDAVAGVLNFITIRKFDGVKVDGSYGFADDFYRYSASATAGKDWGSGSLYASYNYAKNDLLLGGDRDYIRLFPDDFGLTSLACPRGNIQNRGNNTFAGIDAGGTTATLGVPNQCDLSDFATVFPAQRRHSALVGLSQQLNDNISIDLRAFYTNRKTSIQNGPFTFAENVGATTTPFRANFAAFGTNQLVSGRFGPDDASQTRVGLETWGVTPTITANLDGNWQLRVLGSYSQSDSSFRNSTINGAAFRNAIGQGLFNPYAPATAAADVISALTDYAIIGEAKQYFHDVRAIIDGNLFTVPGGSVKLAAGLEYFKEEFDTTRGNTRPGFETTGFADRTIAGNVLLPGGVAPVARSFVVPGQGPLRRASLDRQVKSAFGELVIPIFGADNRTTGLHTLNVSLSGRWDDYDDVGSTFNPRLGVTWKPVEWVNIFGAIGKSFNAPSLADNEESDVRTLNFLTGAAANAVSPPTALVNAGLFPANTGNRSIVSLRGNSPNITPQEAETYNLGFDVRPPFIEGLSFGATYFHLRIENLIGLPQFQDREQLYRNNPEVVNFAPTQAIINNALAVADVFAGISPGTPIDVTTVYAFIDARRRNLGTLKFDGLDIRLTYERPFDFGSVFLNLNATGEFNRFRNSGPGQPFVSFADDAESDFLDSLKARTTLGAHVGDLLGQVTWNHIAGIDLPGQVGFAGMTLPGSPFGAQTFTRQTQIKDFNTFDLFFRYELKDFAMTENLALTLNVENVFDTDPPENRSPNTNTLGATGLRAGRNTLGRLVQFGISTKF